MDSIDYYNQNAADYYEQTVNLDISETVERFIELLPEGAAVLDLGCGSGRDSLTFIEEGFDVTALDGSEELCELAEIHIGQDVLFMKMEEIDFQKVFDGVWACASLLHISEREIDAVLERVIDSLNDDGILYMSFKHGDFHGVRDGRYFSDYNTRKLKDLVNRHKRLEIIEIFKNNDVRKDRGDKKWIHVLARKRKLVEI